MKRFVSLFMCFVIIICSACSRESDKNDKKNPESNTIATSTTEVSTTGSSQYEVTSEEGLRLRTAPSTDSDVITVLEDGTELEVLEVSDGWAKVTYEGQTGYVSAEYIKEQTTTSKSATTTSASTVHTTEKPTVSASYSDSSWDYGYAFPAPKTSTSSDWKLLLVNRDYRLPDNYIDSVELSFVLDDSPERLDSRVVPYYREMYNAAAAEGLYLTPCSGYRSYNLQKSNFEDLITSYEYYGYSREEATIEASKEILPPGTSEHNAGLAMDITAVGDWFGETEEFAWLQENAQDYGFILRYPKDKQDITKIIYEPWHWRFVGVETAKAIKRSGLCLEEYLGVA